MYNRQVILLVPIPEYDLIAGSRGFIYEIYGDNEDFDIAFYYPDSSYEVRVTTHCTPDKLKILPESTWETEE